MENLRVEYMFILHVGLCLLNNCERKLPLISLVNDQCLVVEFMFIIIIYHS